MNLSEDYYLESQIVNSNCSKIWFEYGKKEHALFPLWEGRGRSKTPYSYTERQSVRTTGKAMFNLHFLASFGA